LRRMRHADCADNPAAGRLAHYSCSCLSGCLAFGSFSFFSFFGGFSADFFFFSALG